MENLTSKLLLNQTLKILTREETRWNKETHFIGYKISKVYFLLFGHCKTKAEIRKRFLKANSMARARTCTRAKYSCQPNAS